MQPGVDCLDTASPLFLTSVAESKLVLHLPTYELAPLDIRYHTVKASRLWVLRVNVDTLHGGKTEVQLVMRVSCVIRWLLWPRVAWLWLVRPVSLQFGRTTWGPRRNIERLPSDLEDGMK